MIIYIFFYNNTYSIAYLKYTKRVDLKSSHHKKENCDYEVRDVNLTHCGEHFTIYTSIALAGVAQLVGASSRKTEMSQV